MTKDKKVNKDFNKKYQVVFIDEYDNWYEVGWFDDLKEAEPLLNEQLEGYRLCEDDEMDPGATPKFGDGFDCNLGRLEEYSGTYGPVFDRNIVVEEGCVQVRGFVR